MDQRSAAAAQFSDKLMHIDRMGDPFRFENPAVALKLLEKLDTDSILDAQTTLKKRFKTPFKGLAVVEDYCKNHRAYLVNHPEIVFDRVRLVSEFWRTHQLKNLSLAQIKGIDVQPEIASLKNKHLMDKHAFAPAITANMYFTKDSLYKYRQVGKHFSCLSQVSNHIPGNTKMLRKDYVGNAIAEYRDTFASKPPSCFNDKFFPDTFVLWRKDHCETFFKFFTSADYTKLKKERGVVYLVKISTGVHQGKGVFPLTEEEEVKLLRDYDSGKLCGENKENILIQQLIHNPLLLEGRKFDFRVYMLVASTNPMIAYFHDGYLRISLSEYDPNSKAKNTFVTNIVLNRDVFDIAEKNGTYNGMTKSEMQDKTCWWFNDLQKYLREQGKIVDPEWLDNHLRTHMKKIMIHLVRMSENYFYKQSSLSELYGIDLLMDDNLDIWFIELNTMPLIQGWTEKSINFFNKMFKDYFEIEHALLKSRMKRVIRYINMLSSGHTKSEDFTVTNWDEAKQEFNKISSNYFEPEYEPSPKNGFQLIVNNNFNGPSKYSNILPEQCI